MDAYMTPDEVAQLLRVQVGEVLSLIEKGKLRAIRIGDNLRVRESELENLQSTCAATPAAGESRPPLPDAEIGAVASGSRWVLTRTGRARFRVSGSVAEGAKIWPGRMQYPIKFPKEFMEAMLVHFGGREIPVGGKFDDPGFGSLGEFIQRELRIKMNPAVYLAALLIDEKYAESSHRGYIRFHSKSDA